MKHLFIVVIVIAAVLAVESYSPEQIAKLKTLSKECEESTHVEHERIVHLRQKHFHDDDQHLKDYMLCMFKKMHWMGDDGHIAKDAIKKFVSGDTHSVEAMGHCMDKHGSTHAETAYTVYKCYLEHLPADYKYPM